MHLVLVVFAQMKSENLANCHTHRLCETGAETCEDAEDHTGVHEHPVRFRIGHDELGDERATHVTETETEGSDERDGLAILEGWLGGVVLLEDTEGGYERCRRGMGFE